jgi:FdhD protein
MGAAQIELESDITAFVLTPRAQHLRPVSDAPLLTGSGGQLLREIEVLDETGERRKLRVPVERPLTISIDGQELVTLMTLGAKPELLALGYLRNQRIIEAVTEIESITVDLDAGRAVVVRRAEAPAAGAPTAGESRAEVPPAMAPPAGEPRLIGTACSLGTEFGELMRQVDSAVSPRGTARIARRQLLRILEITREYDAIHRTAGSVHGCALFQGDDLLVSLEDVSRHNGLDTVVGWMLLYGVRGEDKTLFTTGRLTGEMVMKAAHNGISIMVSRNGVTSMGYELAARLGMVLFGRAAKDRYFCYTGAHRFDSNEQPR